MTCKTVELKTLPVTRGRADRLPEAINGIYPRTEIAVVCDSPDAQLD
ncbi:hypothetical protein KCP73_12945 [Salmonella enterica subsp. enterica]|nr:hypothetical protein KCP73_12945 [Salmonella enterica subsp. enterica]